MLQRIASIFTLLIFFSPTAFSQECLYTPIHQNITNNLLALPKNGNILRIPVVIHIVLPEELQHNVSDQDVHNQIKALNRDFRKKNYNWNLIEERYHELVADTKIEFVLSCKDDTGQEASGIVRKITSLQNIGIQNALYFTNEGGSDAWPTNHYLNIWVCDMPKEILGFATAPQESEILKDGIVINHSYFNINRATPRYDMGRTLVHEVGHYLGLNHPWGNMQDECIEDDGLDDTPLQSGPHYDCTDDHLMCSEDEVFYGNFMDYSPDCCLAMFTKQQAMLMRSNLINLRSGLLENEMECQPVVTEAFDINIYPNPSFGHCTISWEEKNIKNISVYNNQGQQLNQIDLLAPNEQVELCLDQYPKGLLLLSFIDESGNVYSKQLIHL